MREKVEPADKNYYSVSNGKCVTFQLKSLVDLKEVQIKSPVPVNIYIHAEDQFYARELRKSLSFTGKQSFEIKVSKTINLNKKTRKCYAGLVCILVFI